MKKLLFSLALLCLSTVSYAQSTLVATLSHGEEISMYYGPFAYRDAMNAASNGDVINLSGGGFQSVTISKAVSIRGTGIDDTNPTYLINDFKIQAPNEGRLTMEGIRCPSTITMEGTFSDAYFLKCQIKSVVYSNSQSIQNTMFIDCKITDGYTMGSNSTAQFINSYIYNFDSSNSGSTSNANFVNCVMSFYTYLSNCYVSKVCYSNLFNCIICGSQLYYTTLPSSSSAVNCVAINSNSTLFSNSEANIGCSYHTFSEVFKDYSGTYSDIVTFELTDEAKTGLLGNDGTEVGMYGGLVPYSSTPSYPRITKMNVANKTTADGKLSVEIEVSAVE